MEGWDGGEGSPLKSLWLHQKKLTWMLARMYGPLPLGCTTPGSLWINTLKWRAIGLYTVHVTRSMGMHGAPTVETVQHSCSTAIPTQLVSSQKSLRVIFEMNIEVRRNFTGVFSIWTGVLHIYLQQSRAKKNSRRLGKLHHKRKIMNVRLWDITFID